MVSEGDAEASVKLEEDSYTIFVVTDTSNLHLLESYLQTFYSELLLEEKIIEATATSTDGERDQTLNE